MKPLSKKTRSIVFIILLTIFIIGAPVLILYSTGYRLGDALSLIKTGGIFIHSNISGTKVYLDDEFVETNGVILRNTLIQNLRPNKIYHVRVEKEGYHTWEKDFRIIPNLVTESQVLMLPKEVQFREKLEFSELSDSNVTATGKTTFNPEYTNIAELFSETLGQFEIEVATTTKKYVAGVLRTVTSTTTEFVFPDFIEELDIEDIEEKELLREKQKIITWLDNGKVNVVWGGVEAAAPYFFCSVSCAESVTLSLDSYINYYDFMPGRDDVLVVLTQEGVFAVEIDARSSKPNIQPIMLGRGLDFRVENNNTIIVKDGEVFKEVQL